MAELEKASSAQGLGDEAFMSVADLKVYVAEVESAKASQSYGAIERAEKAKREMIDKLMQRVEITPDRVEGFLNRVKAAALRGETEMMVLRFPSELCTDKGRALNNAEPGWPDAPGPPLPSPGLRENNPEIDHGHRESRHPGLLHPAAIGAEPGLPVAQFLPGGRARRINSLRTPPFD